LAFSLISDIVLTMQMYLAVVMGTVYKASESMKSLILILFLISSLIFGYILGKLADKFGYKKILMITCFMLVINCLIFFSSSAQRVLYLIAIIWWIASGWYFGVTKAFMVKLSPSWELWEYFGLYSTFHKAASITAPLIRWWITLRLIQYPVLKYQVAWWVMTALLVVWTILMMKVKEK
jgi:MFS family permease